MKLEISLNEAKILHENGFMVNKLEKHFPELKKPVFVKKYEDIKHIKGYFIDKNSEIVSYSGDVSCVNKNIFTSKRLAVSTLAFSQLSQILFNYYGMNSDDWLDNNNIDLKYWFIYYSYDINDLEVELDWVGKYNRLYFKSENDAKESMKLHKNLWLNYYGIEVGYEFSD